MSSTIQFLPVLVNRTAIYRNSCFGTKASLRPSANVSLSENSSLRLTISVPLDLRLEMFNFRGDNYTAAQTHCLAFSPERHFKLVIKVDLKPRCITVRGHGNWAQQKQT